MCVSGRVYSLGWFCTTSLKLDRARAGYKFCWKKTGRGGEAIRPRPPNSFKESFGYDTHKPCVYIYTYISVGSLYINHRDKKMKLTVNSQTHIQAPIKPAFRLELFTNKKSIHPRNLTWFTWKYVRKEREKHIYIYTYKQNPNFWGVPAVTLW